METRDLAGAHHRRSAPRLETGTGGGDQQPVRLPRIPWLSRPGPGQCLQPEKQCLPLEERPPGIMEPLRKPLQSVWNIVLFNWHCFALPAGIMLLLALAWRLAPDSLGDVAGLGLLLAAAAADPVSGLLLRPQLQQLQPQAPRPSSQPPWRPQSARPRQKRRVRQRHPARQVVGCWTPASDDL